MGYMTTKKIKLGDVELVVSRCGYTGEDGFEISIPNDYAEGIASLLLKDERVKPIGLGARDTLRLEAGLCLYGHDINEDITAVEADLIWTIAAAKRKNGGFLGDKIICPQIASTVVRYIRSGLVGEGRQPVREGAKLYNLEDEEIGFVTSGTFSPSLQLPISMGYVHPDYADMGDIVYADVRGKKIPLAVTELPFIPHTTRSAG
jgi:aminomethyltransferase